MPNLTLLNQIAVKNGQTCYHFNQRLLAVMMVILLRRSALLSVLLRISCYHIAKVRLVVGVFTWKYLRSKVL